MLVELHVAGLGVIDDARISFTDGLTALTGETGAGKTLLVDALELVLGGRVRRGLVGQTRTALVEAVFVDDAGSELIVARELPVDGRARAFIDGRMASAAALEEATAGLCDIYGQHEHQSLLGASAPRRSLDAFGGISTDGLRGARRTLRELEAEREELGGTPEEVAREMALLEHQVAEIDRVGIDDPLETERLLETAQLLESAGSLRAAIERAHESLAGEAVGPRDELAALAAVVAEFGELRELTDALRSAEAALTEVAAALRDAADQVEEDPKRLAEVNERLSLLTTLSRRYGPSLAEVASRRDAMAAELEQLREASARRESLEERLEAAADALAREEAMVLAARRAAAPPMATAIGGQLDRLALERAVVELTVAGPGGDDVELLFSANPGIAPHPVAKVASGGELARLMLAIRLTLPGGPATMVFDEVDAGIGGATARSLASALRELADQRQVLVVTHLAQIAAVADRQIGVTKQADLLSTSASVEVLEGTAREAEIARMLSGQPDSEAALKHAAELLAD